MKNQGLVKISIATDHPPPVLEGILYKHAVFHRY